MSLKNVFFHNRYPHNYYCLQRRAAELAGASTQTLLTVGFGGLQHVRGEEEEGRCLSDVLFVRSRIKKTHMEWCMRRIIVAISARINLNLFFRYLTL